MIARTYIDFCETLWSDWCASQLKLPLGLSNQLQLDHAPEPYLRFGDGAKALYVLFTNPGAGMLHQRRDVVMAGKSCIGPQMSYQEASSVLARFYLDELPVGAARARNSAMEHIRELLSADSIMQFESLPFHSALLPRKADILRIVAETKTLREYASVLAEAMRDLSVVALSAVDSSQSISGSSVAESVWLSWQASLLGIDSARLTLAPLAEKGGKITSAFLYQRIAGCTRGFVLMMGGNTFPAMRGRESLARILNSCI